MCSCVLCQYPKSPKGSEGISEGMNISAKSLKGNKYEGIEGIEGFISKCSVRVYIEQFGMSKTLRALLSPKPFEPFALLQRLAYYQSSPPGLPTSEHLCILAHGLQFLEAHDSSDRAPTARSRSEATCQSSAGEAALSCAPAPATIPGEERQWQATRVRPQL
jgi:hypothetical protein